MVGGHWNLSGFFPPPLNTTAPTPCHHPSPKYNHSNIGWEAAPRATRVSDLRLSFPPCPWLLPRALMPDTEP